MFARIRHCLHALARHGRRPRPSPTAVLLVVVVPFVIGAKGPYCRSRHYHRFY